MSAILDNLAYGAIRSALTLATAGDLQGRLRLAGALGSWFGSSRWNRQRISEAAGHIRVAFPQWDEPRRRDYAVRSYRHIFQLGIELSYSSRLLSFEGWSERVEMGGITPAVRTLLSERPVIFVTGHVGNWELSAYSLALLGYPVHALYRPLDLAPLDRWVRSARGERGLVLVDKFGATRILPEVMQRRTPVGFVADQNAGERGMFVPFFGRLASTYKAIAVLAQRFGASVITGVAYRVGAGPACAGGPEREPPPMRYRLELVDGFGPEDYEHQPDPTFYITARWRRGLEACIRLAPEQYLWMHRAWKSRPAHEMGGKPFPARLEQKLRELPWMTPGELERLKAWSEADTDACAKNPKFARYRAAASAPAQTSDAE